MPVLISKEAAAAAEKAAADKAAAAKAATAAGTAAAGGAPEPNLRMNYHHHHLRILRKDQRTPLWMSSG